MKRLIAGLILFVTHCSPLLGQELLVVGVNPFTRYELAPGITLAFTLTAKPDVTDMSWTLTVKSRDSSTTAYGQPIPAGQYFAYYWDNEKKTFWFSCDKRLQKDVLLGEGGKENSQEFTNPLNIDSEKVPDTFKIAVHQISKSEEISPEFLLANLPGKGTVGIGINPLVQRHQDKNEKITLSTALVASPESPSFNLHFHYDFPDHSINSPSIPPSQPYVCMASADGKKLWTAYPGNIDRQEQISTSTSESEAVSLVRYEKFKDVPPTLKALLDLLIKYSNK